MNNKRSIRIFLADDHHLIREGVKALLEDVPGFEVVGEADGGQEALQKIKELKPDVALIDVAMPDLNGLDLVAQSKAAVPTTKMIILSVHADQEYVVRAFRNGADGYLLKTARTTELKLAINSVLNNEHYVTPAVSKALTRLVSEGGRHRETQASLSPLEKLTPRQHEVLGLIVQGKRTKDIARLLNISTSTAYMHRYEIMDKLDIHEVAGLVRFVLCHGPDEAEPRKQKDL